MAGVRKVLLGFSPCMILSLRLGHPIDAGIGEKVPALAGADGGNSASARRLADAAGFCDGSLTMWQIPSTSASAAGTSILARDLLPRGLARTKQLEFAGKHLNATEINATYYKLQSPEL
jgi:hypothetical protein